MNFQVIQYVTSGLSLLALIVLVILYAYKAHLQNRAELLEKTPENERAELAKKILGELNIPVNNLTADAQERLANIELGNRARKTELTVKYGFWAVVVFLAAAIVTLLLPKPPSPDDESRLTLGQHIEFRHWFEYVGSDGRPLSRADRLNGPAGLLLFPEFSVVSGVAKSYRKMEIIITLSGSATEAIRFSPLFIAGTGRSNDSETFWNQQDDFKGVNASIGDPWVEQVGAKAQSQISYQQFVGYLVDEKFRRGLMEVTIFDSEQNSLGAKCEFDLIGAREFVERERPKDGTAPNIVYTTCEGGQV